MQKNKEWEKDIERNKENTKKESLATLGKEENSRKTERDVDCN